MPIPARTHDELAQLARDIVAGQVFTDRHCQDLYLLRSIFMPFLFLDEEHLSQLRDDPPGLIFEYLREAGERGVNGYPTFMSMQMLNRAVAEQLFDLVQRLQAAMNDALAP